MFKYYKNKYARWSSSDVFVLLDNIVSGIYPSNGRMGIYCPVGQHSEASVDYVLNDCKEITKAQYIKASNGLYTPEDYLI